MEQMRRGALLACVLALPLFMGADGCGGIPWPPPRPTPSPTATPAPTPTPEPTPTPPSPQCVEGQACGCWHFPPDSRTWLYACCVPSAPGGVINVVGGPAQCPVQPTPTPPGPTPTPTPPVSSACPRMPSAAAQLYMNNRKYGQGLDSTLRVRGDEPFCEAIHGEVAGPDCHLDGMPAPWTTIGCEMALLGGTIGKPVACPVWQYRAAGVVGPCVDDQDAAMSCDHFGSAGGPLDDPKTPTTGGTLDTLKGFEGAPLECAFQRDSHGPIAGPFTIAHGAGEVRSCLPNGQGCGPWVAVDH